MQKWTTVPFKMEDSQMSRIVMIQMPDGFNGIYFLVHHMIADAQSLICFMKDIIELYCNEKYEGVPYPKEMASYIDQLQKDLAYEAGSKAQLRDIEYFQKEIEKGEPIYNGIHGRDKLEAAREMFKNPELRTAFNASDDTNPPWIFSIWKQNLPGDLWISARNIMFPWHACCSWVCVPISRK